MNYLLIAQQLQDLRQRIQGYQLVLFGAGGAGQQVLKLLEQLGIPCAFFVDNDPARWQQQVDGHYPIQPPSVLLHQPAQYFILITSDAGEAITQQLAQMGFSGDQQVAQAMPPDPVLSGRQIFTALYPDYSAALADSTGYQVVSYRDAAVASRTNFQARLAAADPHLNADEQQMLLAVLLTATALEVGQTGQRALRVLDFGGALGEHFLLLRHFAPQIQIEMWQVCETPLLVAAAADLSQPPALQFCTELPDQPVDLVIASGSLQFVAAPVQTFAALSALQAPYLFICRFPLWPGPDDVVARLNVPEHLFTASYPSWHFSLNQWLPRFTADHQLRASWQNHEFYYQQQQRIDFYGYLLQRTSSRHTQESR